MPAHPRIFVSSIMADYEVFRQAARRGIERAGGRPVLVEDSRSAPTSPRNACLDLVESSDAIVILIGPRGGHIAPSGKLVVREEYEEAVRCGMPVFVFLQDADRDPQAEQLADELSDYVGGHFRRTFTTAAELDSEVASALSERMTSMQRADRDPQSLQDLLTESPGGAGQHDTVLRLVLAPTVEDEVVDPLDLDTDEFERAVQRAAHESGFFSYRFGKDRQCTSHHLLIQQGDQRQGYAEIILTTDGILTLGSKFEGRSEDGDGFGGRSMSAMFEIVRSDLEDELALAFAAANLLLQYVDEHERYPSWIFNVALINPGSKTIVDAPSDPNSGYSAGFHRPECVTAYDQPRPINRSTLARPDQEVRRSVALLQKRLDEERSY